MVEFIVELIESLFGVEGLSEWLMTPIGGCIEHPRILGVGILIAVPFGIVFGLWVSSHVTGFFSYIMGMSLLVFVMSAIFYMTGKRVITPWFVLDPASPGTYYLTIGGSFALTMLCCMLAWRSTPFNSEDPWREREQSIKKMKRKVGEFGIKDR